MKLVIVESPTKTKTLKKFLGKGYKVNATRGHIRDLPRKKFGVDLADFTPTYTVVPGKKKVITQLKKQKEESDEIILATDLDREGEAIAWHTAEALGLDKNDYQRIVFHEITETALKQALEEPRKINYDLVNAQQARRILDRIVGYKLSPLLWKKISKGLSAGRVQSVALRFIVEREREIEEFEPREYWSISALLEKEEEFESKLIKIGSEKLSRFDIKTEKEAQKIAEALKESSFRVERVKKKKRKRYPFPPYTTSTLQQDAWKRLHYSSKQTMYLAQQLYEKGLITYHRTDSLNLSSEATRAAGKVITSQFGENYWPGKPRFFKTKSKSAQEAHEAIRPVQPEKDPEKIKAKKKEQELYDLIWRRFIASQMKNALFDQTKARIKAEKYLFRSKGQTLKFDGFLKVYPVRYKEDRLPPLSKGDEPKLKKIKPKQHFTRPPARYNEASLIKELEKNGIGRPSTYAPIISIVQQRNYVNKNEKRRFFPTEIGKTVNDLLVKHFPKIVDTEFTARMEESLDKIAAGDKEWKKVLKEFYEPFSKNLQEKYKEIEKKVEKTDEECPECGSPLVIRMSRYGKFYGCSNFPKCKYTRPIKKEALIKCPECEEGSVVEKRTKKGKIFYGCNRYPECDFALWDKPTGEKCPECNSLLVENKNKIKCSNEECDYVQE